MANAERTTTPRTLRRRRSVQLLVGVVLFIALLGGAVAWMQRLTAVEQVYVGRWLCLDSFFPPMTVSTLDLAHDRTFVWRSVDASDEPKFVRDGRWRVREARLELFENQPDPGGGNWFEALWETVYLRLTTSPQVDHTFEAGDPYRDVPTIREAKDKRVIGFHLPDDPAQIPQALRELTAKTVQPAPVP